MVDTASATASELGECHGFRLEFHYRAEKEPDVLEGVIHREFHRLIHEARCRINESFQKLKAAGIKIVICDQDGNSLEED